MPIHEKYIRWKETNLRCSKQWKKNNREKSREINRRYIRRLHDRVVNFLGGRCIRCGITDKRVLQINHKNGGGCKEFHKIGPLVLYNQILKGVRSKDDLEVRCSNCNLIFRWEEHERETSKFYP